MTPERSVDNFAPCGHEPQQSSAQLHGVCIFCYRDRLGAERQARVEAEKTLDVADRIWLDAMAELTTIKKKLDKALKVVEAARVTVREGLTGHVELKEALHSFDEVDLRDSAGGSKS